MHRDDRRHVPAAALRGLERGDVAGASAFLAQRLLEQVVVVAVLRRAGCALLGVQPHAFAMPRRRAA